MEPLIIQNAIGDLQSSVHRIIGILGICGDDGGNATLQCIRRMALKYLRTIEFPILQGSIRDISN